MKRRALVLGLGLAAVLAAAATALADAGDDGWDELTRSDVATIQYDAEGNQAWGNYYNAPTNDAFFRATALAVDREGNAVVAGKPESGSAVLIRYGADGSLAWTLDYGPNGVGSGDIAAIVINGAGDIFTVGTKPAAEDAPTQLAVVKVTVDGQVAWAKTVASPVVPKGWTTGSSIAPTSDAGVIVAGEATDVARRSNLLAAKISAAGELEGTYQHAPELLTSRGVRVAAAKGGGAFVAGVIDGEVEQLVVLSFDATGVLAWTHVRPLTDNERYCSWALPFAVRFEPTGLLATADGGAVVGATQSIGASCWLLESLDASGTERWARQAGASGNEPEVLDDVVAMGGDLFAAGWTVTDNDGWDDVDVLVRKFAADGTPGWSQTYAGGWGDDGPTYDGANALVVDDDGSVVVAGFSCDWIGYESSGPCDGYWCSLLVLRLDPLGNPRSREPNNGYAIDVAIDTFGHAIVAGTACQYTHHPGGGGGDDGYEDDDNDDFDWPSDDDAGKKKHSGGGCAVGDGNALTLVTLMLAIGGMAWLESRRRLGRR